MTARSPALCRKCSMKTSSLPFLRADPPSPLGEFILVADALYQMPHEALNTYSTGACKGKLSESQLVREGQASTTIHCLPKMSTYHLKNPCPEPPGPLGLMPVSIVFLRIWCCILLQGPWAPPGPLVFSVSLLLCLQLGVRWGPWAY